MAETMQVLVTGAGGQLGHDLRLHCEAQGDDVVACDRAALDVGDRDAVYQAITSLRPDVVLHAGAYTAVDACETEVDTAYRINALGSRWVADACHRVGAYLCSVSTDYVFDGTKLGPYVEWDRTNPQSVYGASKLGGEHEVAAHAPGAAVVRTSWVCGEHGNNMVKTVLRLADRPELAFVDDQRGCPTFTADLAVAMRRLAAARMPGTFHVTNQGDLSWYEFVQAILASAGHDPAKVRPIKTEELDPPRPAPRPANSVLDNAALRLAGEPLLPHYRESLDRLVARLTA
ncbi:MAG TPA: dTDP-4-dehydrorhamnose reductase [Acidimicrobiales bacterium]|nr:dTDP-4-dehydrorhamnose reductase [Acidimicrobiales bacterium]